MTPTPRRGCIRIHGFTLPAAHLSLDHSSPDQILPTHTGSPRRHRAAQCSLDRSGRSGNLRFNLTPSRADQRQRTHDVERESADKLNTFEPTITPALASCPPVTSRGGCARKGGVLEKQRAPGAWRQTRSSMQVAPGFATLSQRRRSTSFRFQNRHPNFSVFGAYDAPSAPWALSLVEAGRSAAPRHRQRAGERDHPGLGLAANPGFAASLSGG